MLRSVVMLRVIILSVVNGEGCVVMLSFVYSECHYAECHHAECHYAKFQYAESYLC